jgi:hypothetical protein
VVIEHTPVMCGPESFPFCVLDVHCLCLFQRSTDLHGKVFPGLLCMAMFWYSSVPSF